MGDQNNNDKGMFLNPHGYPSTPYHPPPDAYPAVRYPPPGSYPTPSHPPAGYPPASYPPQGRYLPAGYPPSYGYSPVWFPPAYPTPYPTACGRGRGGACGRGTGALLTGGVAGAAAAAYGARFLFHGCHHIFHHGMFC